MVEISWTSDTRVEHQLKYVRILYVVLQVLPFLYGDDALMIQLGKIELNLNKSNTFNVVWRYNIQCSTLRGLIYVRRTVIAAIGGPTNSHESVIVNMTCNA